MADINSAMRKGVDGANTPNVKKMAYQIYSKSIGKGFGGSGLERIKDCAY